MAEPAAVSLHSLKQAGVSLGDSVAIFGAGPIGLMLAAFAAAWGALKIILLDIDQTKLDFAKSLGYNYVLDAKDENFVEQVMDITDGKGVDVAVEGAGAAPAYAGCLKIVKPMGQVVLMGNPLGDMPLSQKDYWEILRKQLSVHGTWNSSYTQAVNDWQVALEAMAEGRLDVSQFITHRFDFSDCNKAFDMVNERKEFFNKVMFIDE